MSARTATIDLDGDGLRFHAQAGSGHSIVLDDSTGDTGMRPAELIPVALAGCAAMDVISILRKKRQPVTRYQVRASGIQQADYPHAFERIDVVHVVEGPRIDDAAVQRAIELSATKYCSVGSTLAAGITEIHHAYLIRDDVSEERMAEVVVTGPGRPAGNVLDIAPLA
jgi:putative redox protein